MKKIIKSIILVAIGAIAGTFAGMGVYDYTWAYAIVVFFSIIGVLTLVVLVFATMVDDAKDDDRTYPKPSGWDKKLEK